MRIINHIPSGSLSLLRLTPALLAALLLSSAPTASPAAGLTVAEVQHEGPVDFQREILPILKNNCLACHNQTKAKADLVLETPQSILKGGSSGAGLVPGKPEESFLFQAAAHLDEETIMPPKNNTVAAANLSPHELGLLKRWITEGAQGEVRSGGPIEWQPLPKGVNPIYAVAISPDGQYAACARANQIFLYHLPSSRLLTRLTDPQLMDDGIHGKPGAAHRDLVHSLEFSPDGSLLASSGYREVKLWRRPQPSPTLHLASDQPAPIIAASPDGNWFATASDTNITLWSADGHPTRTLSGHTAPLTSIAFSPDNKTLLSGSTDHTLRLWLVETGDLRASTRTPGEVTAVAWFAGGHQAASGARDGTIRTWQIPDAADAAFKPLNELKGHTGTVSSLSALPTQPLQLLSGSLDGTVQQWDTAESKAIRKLDHGGPVQAVAARPDGKRFASAGANKLVRLWNAEDGKLVADLQGDINARLQIAHLERSQSLANSEVDYRNGVLKAAEETGKQETGRLEKATETARKAGEDLAAKEQALAEANSNKSGMEQEITTQKELAAKAAASLGQAEQLAKTAEEEAATARSMSSTEKAVVERLTAEAGSKSKAAEEARAALEKITRETEAREKELADKIKEAEKTIAKAGEEMEKARRAHETAQTEQTLATKSVETSTQSIAKSKEEVTAAEADKTRAASELEAAKTHASELDQPVNTLAFSPDNFTLVSGGDNERIHTWNAENGEPLESIRTGIGKVSALAFASNNQLITSGTQGTPTAWNLNAGWKLESMLGTGDDSSPFVDRVVALGFSPDGSLLATGGGEPSRSGEILVFQVAGAKLRHSFRQTHSDTVLDVEFAPNGRHLASSAADRFVRVTDLQTEKIVKSFEGHTHHVLGVSWKADGRTLASAGADNVIKVWDFVTGERKKNVEGYGKEVTSVHFIGISDTAISTAGDSKVKIVKAGGGDVRSLDGPKDFVYTSDITPDGKVAIAGGEESILHVWNAEDGKSIATFAAPEP